ncbi:hypothetical protein WJR50_15465 [Catalinimonas sp. 4WD22]
MKIISILQSSTMHRQAFGTNIHPHASLLSVLVKQYMHIFN